MHLELNILPDVTFVSKFFQTEPFHISNKIVPHKISSIILKNLKDTAISMIKHNIKKY